MFKSGFKHEHWADAREIISNQSKDVNADDLPSNKVQAQDEIAAVQLYCTVVVENKTDIEKVPKLAEYMQGVRTSQKCKSEKDLQTLEATA